MATDLEVVGPFEIPYECHGTGLQKHITSSKARSFWDDEDTHRVAGKQGIYVFALKASKGFRPWYIGKATKGMKQECLQSHKLQHYNEVLFRGNNGTPVLFFVVPGGNLRKVPARVIDEMETVFIQTVLAKHPEIKNIQKTQRPQWSVRGVIRGGQGPAPKHARQFRKMMGFE